MSKSQLMELFRTPTNTFIPIKKPVNNGIKEIKPMKLEDKLRLKKKIKREHNQIGKRSMKKKKRKW